MYKKNWDKYKINKIYFYYYISFFLEFSQIIEDSINNYNMIENESTRFAK